MSLLECFLSTPARIVRSMDAGVTSHHCFSHCQQVQMFVKTLLFCYVRPCQVLMSWGPHLAVECRLPAAVGRKARGLHSRCRGFRVGEAGRWAERQPPSAARPASGRGGTAPHAGGALRALCKSGIRDSANRRRRRADPAGRGGAGGAASDPGLPPAGASGLICWCSVVLLTDFSNLSQVFTGRPTFIFASFDK
jgi:hypothetical protein